MEAAEPCPEPARPVGPPRGLLELGDDVLLAVLAVAAPVDRVAAASTHPLLHRLVFGPTPAAAAGSRWRDSRSAAPLLYI